jgi:hypothetical protein
MDVLENGTFLGEKRKDSKGKSQLSRRWNSEPK